MSRRSNQVASAGPSAPFTLEHPNGQAPIGGAQPVGDVVLDAAAVCVQRSGFEGASLEEIAAEAGVSRATLYRRFGSRESLFKALLLARAHPFRSWSTKVLLGPGSISWRLETVLTRAITEMQRVGWLDRSLHAGFSSSSIRLFKAAHSESAQSQLAPLIDELIGDDARTAGITIAELIGWIADQMIAIASGPVLEEDELRRRVRFFVMRVLTPSDSDVAGTDAQLARIEAKLDGLACRREP